MLDLFCRRLSLAIFLMLALSACGGGGGNDPGKQQQYPTSTLKGNITHQQMSGLISLSGIIFSLQPAYDVNYYKVSYESALPSGATVVHSGLLLVPQKGAGAASPLLSIQHGTITSQSLAPSNVNLNTPASVAGDVWAGFAAASFGYVVVMPDYLGYGDSQSQFHPYVQAEPLARSAVDLMRAARTLLNGMNVSLNQQVFLAGYSEGGYATLATQKYIEGSLGLEFNLVASEPGAGPYDISGTVNAVLAASDLSGVTKSGYLAFVLESYHAYYDPSTSLSTYLTSTAETCANTYFAGGWYGANASGNFETCVNSTVTSSILNASFLTAISAGDTSVAALTQGFAANDIYNWKPQVPTRLFHSPTDEAVPYANTTKAYTTMLALNSTSVTVQDCAIPSGTHGSCSVPFFTDVISFFNTYVSGL